MTSQEFAQIRKDLGLTQKQLSEIMSCPIRSISRLETGERQPTKIQAAFLRYIKVRENENANSRK